MKRTIDSEPGLEVAAKTYSDFRFGNPPPTRKQYGYARSLGIQIKDGMTRHGLSDEIDRVVPPSEELIREARAMGIDVQPGMLAREVRDQIAEADAIAELHGPANEEQLEFIKEYHGKLPRKITYAEAERAIEYLQDLKAPDCPRCKLPTGADDDFCLNCAANLRKRQFQISEKVLVGPKPARQFLIIDRLVIGSIGLIGRTGIATGRMLFSTSIFGGRLAGKAAVAGAKASKQAAPQIKNGVVESATIGNAILKLLSGEDRIVYWCLLGFLVSIPLAILLVLIL